ncbi:MAG: DUF4258 domain-containing protein [bacterium]|nr:DUF4258 domain-containing protein [bacterium]
MSLKSIQDDVKSQRIAFGPHLIQRMWESGISIDQVLDTILTGTVNKKERDERSLGRFIKYTISKGDIVVIVKDCKPGFIITANKR